MIHKFFLPDVPHLDVEECEILLNEHQFHNVIPSSHKSTFDLFEADFQRNHYFVKMAPTGHLLGENLNLQRELLSELYPQLQLTLFQSPNLVFLAIPELEKLEKYSFEEVEEVVDQMILSSAHLSKIVPKDRKVASLIATAFNAVRYFNEMKVLSQEMCDIVTNEITYLVEYVDLSAKLVNHGDLSNPNIFKLDGIPILLDWEDVMIGYSGYDQVYWLTFFANSNEITVDNLKKIPAPLEVIRATFYLVVILKEYLFALKGETRNRTSTQVRLSNLQFLPKFRQS